jgi:hypothetical protein
VTDSRRYERFNTSQRFNNCEAVAAYSLGSEWLVSASHSQPQDMESKTEISPPRYGGYAAKSLRGRCFLYCYPGVTRTLAKARFAHPRLSAIAASRLESPWTGTLSYMTSVRRPISKLGQNVDRRNDSDHPF